jgi:hypothetical protein
MDSPKKYGNILYLLLLLGSKVREKITIKLLLHKPSLNLKGVVPITMFHKRGEILGTNGLQVVSIFVNEGGG